MHASQYQSQINFWLIVAARAPVLAVETVPASRMSLNGNTNGSSLWKIPSRQIALPSDEAAVTSIPIETATMVCGTKIGTMKPLPVPYALVE